MKYPYTAYSVDPSSTIPDGTVHRPEVVLRIIGSSGEVYVTALLDTGADECILPSWVASATIGFAHFESPDDEYAILGHAGCLNIFTLTFDAERREATITPNANFPVSD